MKRVIPTLILFLALVPPFTLFAEEVLLKPAQTALSLSDCYALALKRSETVAMQQELIQEAEGRFLRAFGVILPHASFSSSDKRQDGSGSSAFTLKEVPERKFIFTQNLFSGFKEIAAMKGARAQKRQRIHEKLRVEQLLLLDVAEAFYLLLEQRKDLELLKAMRKVLLERINQLKEREKIGRSRPSEIVSTEAQLARIEAEEEELRSQETTARQLLEFLTGREPIETILEEEALPSSLSPERDYLVKVNQRPDIQAAQEAFRAAQKQLSVTKAGFWPTVELEGNYYVEREGVAKDVDWDAELKVDVPLFQGGETLGAVKEATAQTNTVRLELEKTERSALLDIREAYSQFHRAIDRVTLLEKALKASEENYRLQAEEYRLSLVSNLDVLKALQELQDAQRDHLHALYEAKRLYWRLRVAMGEVL